MGNLQFSYPVIITIIGCLAVIYIICNLLLQLFSKIIFDWFSKGRKKESINNGDSSNNSLMVSIKESHLKIEQQILKVLEAQNNHTLILRDLLSQVKTILLNYTQKVGNNVIK